MADCLLPPLPRGVGGGGSGVVCPPPLNEPAIFLDFGVTKCRQRPRTPRPLVRDRAPRRHLLEVTNCSHYTWDGAPHIALLAQLFLLMPALLSSGWINYTAWAVVSAPSLINYGPLQFVRGDLCCGPALGQVLLQGGVTESSLEMSKKKKKNHDPEPKFCRLLLNSEVLNF